MPQVIGACGDHCVFCPRSLATKSGNLKALENVKDLWARLGLREPSFPAADLACHGCGPENKCAYPDVRACASTKKIANCGLCAAYPCWRIEAVFEKTEKFKAQTKPNLSAAENALINKAFWSKKKYLDEIHRENQKRICRSAVEK